MQLHPLLKKFYIGKNQSLSQIKRLQEQSPLGIAFAAI
ncbi:hypothetical protein DB29_01058 [Shouchella clausii]|nr:hypothetical protein DB29_01058 [Shouchella clausii]